MSNLPKSPPSESFKFGAFWRNPVATAIVAIVVFILWTLPIGIAQAWPALVRDKTIPEWLAERRWPGMTAQVYTGLTVVFAVALLALLVVLIITSRRRGAPPQETGVREQPPSTPAAEVGGSEHRVAELEREIRRLQNDNDTLQTSLAGKINYLESHRRAHEIVEHQRQALRKFVLVENCTINSSHLSEGNLYVDFTFSIFNLSMHSISIPMLEGAVIEGPILFKGKMLSGGAKLFRKDVNKILPTDRSTFTLRQWVNQSEANDILETLKKVGNLFDFSQPAVYVRADESADAKAAKLDLARGMQNADLENKVIRLEHEIAAWQRHSGTIEQLQHALGGAYVLYRLFEAGEPPSKERIKYWFDSTLHGHFHSDFLKAYFEGMPELTDSPAEQKDLIDRHCFKLRRLIAEEREKLAVARNVET